MTEKQTTSNKLTMIILAAGKGTRMKTSLPKVLHPVSGEPMISRAVKTSKLAGATEVRVVVGYGAHLVKEVVEPLEAICFPQAKQLGTADAVKSANPGDIEGTMIILNGDHPLIQSEDLTKIVKEFEQSHFDLGVVTCELKKPKSFGRIVRRNGQIKAIVEAKDASHDTLKIKEVNTGIYIGDAKVISTYLDRVQPNNSQGEYYLTDIVSLMLEDGKLVGGIKAPQRVSFGVNSQVELAQATKYNFKQKAKSLLETGVMIMDPMATYIEDSVEVGPATVIYPGVFLRGNTKVGSYCVIEPNAYICNSKLDDGVVVKAMSHLEEAVIHTKATLGPFARLRPGTEVMEEAAIGNFVELKKTKFGKGSKAGHLTYLGDAEIGEGVNIGCGTITCNYAADKKKYKTTIGDNTFVGSDSQFVAPVNIGKNVVIGSGSTITKDVPDDALAVARGKQFIKENYTSKYKKKD